MNRRHVDCSIATPSPIQCLEALALVEIGVEGPPGLEASRSPQHTGPAPIVVTPKARRDRPGPSGARVDLGGSNGDWSNVDQTAATAVRPSRDSSPTSASSSAGRGRFEALDQCTELEGEQAVGPRVAPDEGEEGVGPDQHGLGLAVDGQDESGIGVFERLQDLGEVAVQLSAPDVADKGMRHHHPHEAENGQNGRGERRGGRVEDAPLRCVPQWYLPPGPPSTDPDAAFAGSSRRPARSARRGRDRH